MGRFKAVKVLKIMFFGTLFLIGMSFLVAILWNALMPVVFDLPRLNIMQAFLLLVLTRLLTGGFRPGWGGGPRHSYWKQKMEERWDKMTPEERERWKHNWGGRCGKMKGEEEKEGQGDRV